MKIAAGASRCKTLVRNEVAVLPLMEKKTGGPVLPLGGSSGHSDREGTAASSRTHNIFLDLIVET